MLQKPRLFIAMPAFGFNNCTQTTITLLKLVRAICLNGSDYGFGSLSYPDISELRNMFLTLWYDRHPDCTHLLFIDSDMAFEPELVFDMCALDKPLVGVIARKRKPEVEYVGTVDDQRDRKAVKLDATGGMFMEIDGIGAGVMLIRRDCVSRMIELKPELLDHTPLDRHVAGDMMKKFGFTRLIRAFDKVLKPDGTRLSEDLSFSLRHKQCGGEVWASISHRIGHIGQQEFAGCYMDAVGDQLKMEKEKPATVQSFTADGSNPIPLPPTFRPMEPPLRLEAAE